MAALVLASASPRRRELLERVGLAIEVQPADLDETPSPGEPPAAYALRVAGAKARAIAARLPDRMVLAADTVVAIDGDILGKAGSSAEAAAMLRRLSRRTHEVITAFVLSGPAMSEVARAVVTEVDFRALAPEEIDGYVAAGEWEGKAGAYAAQGMAAAFVTAVRGSFTNVVGLPLAEVLIELARAGAAHPRFERGRPA